MASITIKDAKVNYLIRQARPMKGTVSTGHIGGRITRTKRFTEITALENVTLDMKTGDRVGLIGTNGSGKTTLLRLCAGALSPAIGSIEIEGRVAPQFSMMSGIRSELSGRLNVELKCLYLDVPHGQIPKLVERVRELSGLDGYFELPVTSYSAGMRSRLLLAMLVLVRADILVLDEWIGAADASLTETTNEVQTELIERTSLLLLASHSEEILRKWTNRLIWLDAGRIVRDGPVDEVLSAYRNSIGLAS